MDSIKRADSVGGVRNIPSLERASYVRQTEIFVWYYTCYCMLILFLVGTGIDVNAREGRK